MLRTFSTFTRQSIPRAVREQVWLKKLVDMSNECQVTFMKNTITVFDFLLGHNVPVSKGG